MDNVCNAKLLVIPTLVSVRDVRVSDFPEIRVSQANRRKGAPASFWVRVYLGNHTQAEWQTECFDPLAGILQAFGFLDRGFYHRPIRCNKLSLMIRMAEVEPIRRVLDGTLDVYGLPPLAKPEPEPEPDKQLDLI